ncbi:MAG: HEAT repeat domain-containing protein [Methanobrevibacter sp.]|nr:HEAT repeat domain-containing protein [Candidatus Methanovirga aequatorialis]
MESRKKRGWINSDDLKPFKDFESDDLITMLSDKDPQKRTIAATLLNEGIVEDDNDKKHIIVSLLKSSKREKTLYSRMAIFESLVSYGELSVPYLIKLLGVIGSNQEKQLPKKYFNKKSFPLPRDLAARTLAKMGNTPIPYLVELLKDNNITNFKKEQALDVIGAIAYKYNDHRAFDSINDLFANIGSEDFNKEPTTVLVWKIVRSLSGFKNNMNALNLVINVFKRFDHVNEIQWEVIRSIGQIGIVNTEVQLIFENFDNRFYDDGCYVDSQIKLALKVSKNSLDL